MHPIRTAGARRPAMLFLTLVVALFVVACAGSSAGAAAPVSNDTSGSGSEAWASAAPSAASGVDNGAAGPVAGASSGGDPIGLIDDAKIVRTGNMTLDVTDVGQAVATARDIVRGVGGYIGASNTSYQDDEPVASITYRIPVAKWEETLAALRSLNGLTKKIVVEETEAVEVTGQVIDLQARIKNLQASEAALQVISAKAGKISDVLAVQAQLTDVRGQIEVLAGDLKDLSGRADYATLTVQFGTPIVAVEAARKGWDPKVVVDDAAASMVGILQGLAGAGIWFAIVWLPILIVVAIFGGITAWILRRTGMWRRAAPPAPPAPPAPVATA